MFVVKRSGERVAVDFNKITTRIARLSTDLPDADAYRVAQRVVAGLCDGITTTELDDLAAETAAALSSSCPEYGLLAGRIAVTSLHKSTSPSLACVVLDLCDLGVVTHKFVDDCTSDPAIEAAIQHDRDQTLDIFAFRTLARSYLLKSKDGKIIERPQHLFMRAAVAIHGSDVQAAIETYDMMSRKIFIHATPTLYNSGLARSQLSSCFLMTFTPKTDSIDGIFEMIKKCATISKYAGGIGLSVTAIRATGSYVAGTNGVSNGIVPMLRVFNETARLVDQGGGKRKGAFAIYIEPWHADIEEFLDLRKNHGKEESRARDLFYGMWTPDLFMRRVERDDDWTLFDPACCPGLSDTYGPEFDRLYAEYETKGLGKRVVKARTIWNKIIQSQIESGTPYMLYKDACNAKSNQKNIGIIRCSNLCAEIVEHTSDDEIAVCNLASINLRSFVHDRTFDFVGLAHAARTLTKNLNNVLDVTYSPVPEALRSNTRNRPIGVGVQALADTFFLMRYPFDSEPARLLNKQIFETIYYACLDQSCLLAETHGPYTTYEGSPASKGLLQFDMWTPTPRMTTDLDWAALKARIAKHGLRNSLLVALMPTASTSQILGNIEAFEAANSNLYMRRTLSGEFTLVNQYLVNDLKHLNLWNETMKERIIGERGSIQNISAIPADIRELYRTVWEIKQKVIVEMSADRAPFVDQSQSLNIHMEDPTIQKISSMHFFAWNKGLKTGMYYLRTKPKVNAIAFTVDQSTLTQARLEEPVADEQITPDASAKVVENECEMCGA